MIEIFGRCQDVVVRSWREDDVDDYLRIVGDTNAMQFISGGATRSREAAREEIDRFIREIATRGWSRFAVSLGEVGPFVGYVGFAQKEEGIDFGGRTVPEFWGKPYTSLACWIGIEIGLVEIGFDSIYSLNHVDHYRARRMTERFGFAFTHMVETPIGSHRRFELHRSAYLEAGIRERNRDMIERLSRRGGPQATMRPERGEPVLA